ncbi:hypothetical protein [Nocardioides sp. SYSU DS0663]|uniref:hypothetical protein n=1 Tax=Nocardioides sp. SYSU DS0663 TaxID=3416445 RepID=UPI003F4C0C4A
MSAGRPRAFRADLRRRGLLLLALFGGPGLVLAAFAEGAMRLLGAATLVACCCLWSLVRRVRRPSETFDPGAGLPVVIEAARPIARLLAVAYGATLLGVGAVTVQFVLAPDEESNRRAVGFVAVVVLSIPSAARLAWGGRRAWRLELDRSGIRYRGGRREEHVPWPDLGEVAVDADDRYLLLGHRQRWREPVSVPVVGFDVHPQRLVELVEETRTSASSQR